MHRTAQIARQVAVSATVESSPLDSATHDATKGREHFVDLRCKSVADVLASASRVKWNGWGYSDTGFILDERTGEIGLSGERYSLSGKNFPNLRPWVEETLGIDVDIQSPAQSEAEALEQVPAARTCPAFTSALDEQKWCAKASTEPADRLAHAHGHTCEDIWKLRYSTFDRFPDLVLWPADHEGVVGIVELASRLSDQVTIIPYGGGTTVCHAVEPPAGEERFIISLDMRCMNRVLWIDRESRLLCVEAGVVGKELDETLERELGVCTGHEPDSAEFSTLGGWISTRASGMKKNVYGNIEDIVVGCALVTPAGVLERGSEGAPRMSAGPDINNIVIGSEGTLGVVTRAIMKIRAVPAVKRYGSIIFHSFEDGAAFMQKLAKHRVAPASVRLVDNPQFQLGALLKPAAESLWSSFTDAAKKTFVTRILGFDVNAMVAATLSFEGQTAAAVKSQEDAVYALAKLHGGVAGGEENGIRGYFLTYMIAYIRDFGYDYNFIAESFETSAPWSCVMDVCNNTKARIAAECERRGISKRYVSARITQTYDSGAAIYFYFGFVFRGLSNPVQTFSEIEAAARDEVMASGGCVSHHHGIGKLRQKWVEETVSPVGLDVFRGVKASVDPNNLFGVGNLVPRKE